MENFSRGSRCYIEIANEIEPEGANASIVGRTETEFEED